MFIKSTEKDVFLISKQKKQARKATIAQLSNISISGPKNIYSRKHNGSVGVISRFFVNLQTHTTFSGVGCGHGHIDSKQMAENST